ncbi:HD domain-containing protein [Cellulomonas xiejunii]|uniref:HD domain-containing protein n=1 Tax=Cellulomonas xiejunii TaxID=2968083 RepID=UPI001D0DF285|nr:HD domain-containing protein [Cellulomonas xiejunii]MCC2314193.1 HD domain-containing protein [Cellulomonas xiejunii]
MTDLVTTARQIAKDAHRGQLDKAGAPYIGHPARVAGHAAAAGGDERVVAAAWLHDVVEDTDVTPDDLRAAGIPDDVVAAVVALSKVPGQSVEDYFAAVNRDPIAVAVKSADLADNTDPARLALLDEGTRQRLVAKYARARSLLGAPLDP